MWWSVLVGLMLFSLLVYVSWKFIHKLRTPQTTPEECGGWKAWLDRMPGPGRTPTLHVTGECSFPTAGYSVELKLHSPQGINPAYLMLDKIVRKPSGPVEQVVTVVKVDYHQDTDVIFQFVNILPDGGTIQVRQVS